MRTLATVPVIAAAALAALAVPATAAPADTTSTYQAGYTASGAAHAFTKVDAHWTVPKVSCAATDDNAVETTLAFGDSDDGQYPVQLGVDSACEGEQPPAAAPSEDYYAFTYTKTGRTNALDNPVAPGDTMHGTIASDGTGNYTFTLVDETKKWTSTTQGSSPQTTDADAEVMLDSLAGDQAAVPTFDKATFTDVTLNDKPLTDAKPARSVLTDKSGATLVTPTALGTDGGFTCAYQAKG